MRWLCSASAALALAAAPALAQAGQDDIWNGYIAYPNAPHGPRHSLSSVWTTHINFSESCVNAYNDDGSGWAGDTYCTTTSNVNIGHPYCACQLRYGYAFGLYDTVYYGDSAGYWRQFW